jgi:hypothetical protein
MCKDYYTLQFMDPAIDTSPIAPALQVREGCWWTLTLDAVLLRA